jgi:Leucine-rich repeat (LRR) protein
MTSIQLQATANVPSSELTALHQLYNSTDGWNWHWRPVGAHWKFTPTANPCTGHWQGITCVLPAPHTTYYVNEISLSGYHLQGPLPASIGAFSHLATLELSHNAINGTIPRGFAQLSSLSSLTLSFNDITGGLSDSLCELRNLQHLYAQNMPLGGTIPSCFGQLTQLRNLTLTESQLTGTIPVSLGNMTHLQTLVLRSNHLNGSLPSSLGELNKLEIMIIDNNNLTGSIPPSVVELPILYNLNLAFNALDGTLPAFPTAFSSRLITLTVEYNALTGTISASLGNLPALTTLELNNNRFTGTIPASLSNISTLVTFELGGNTLSGPIPTSLVRMQNVGRIDFADNTLTGTLPAGMGNMSALFEIDIEYNCLTGTIPASFGALALMQQLVLDNNLLTGSMPASLGDLAVASELMLFDNMLTGPIPDSYGRLSMITTFDLAINFLSGTLPDGIGNMTLCSTFYVTANLLHGTVPDGIGALTRLTQLDMGFNMLTGSLPSALTDIRVLNLLLMRNNRFSGNLDRAFNASKQPSLQTVQLNNNQLTGTIPAEVFRLPGLQTFVALSNCFHGTLPTDACNATELNSLVLDGLSSATSCRRTLPSGAYLLSRSVGGTLPKCLFQLPRLHTLHLSGNTFSGVIPSNVTLHEVLQDVTLSHNVLTGAIPSAFQQRRWSNFDLSYNRLTGSLHADFSTVGVVSNTSAVSLENNRLSGKIPSPLQQMRNVSMLGTNHFECNLAGSNLPQHDSNHATYQCGSVDFDIPYYLWLSLVVPVVALLIWRWIGPSSASLASATQQVSTWYTSSQRVVDGRQILPSLMHVLDTLKRSALYCGAYVTVVLVPCYLLLSHYYGTLTHQYAWTVSAAFLSGVVPVAVELPLWLLVLCILMYILHRALPKAEHFAQPTRAASTVDKPRIGLSAEVRNRATIRTLFVLIDLVVVVGVNVLYVYIAIYQSSALLVLAQVLMSFFKLLWSSTCLDIILRALAGTFCPELFVGDGYAMAYRTEFLSLHLFVSLVNSIVIPCLVVASISPDCFYNVFQQAPVVKSHYSYRSCLIVSVSGGCVATAEEFQDTSYSTPYTYNYQCSSSLITYYAPAYINLCIAAAVLDPLGSVIGTYLLKHSSQESRLHAFLSAVAPHLATDIPPVENDLRAPTYINANQVLVILVTCMGVLLTFGAVLPPLGVALVARIAMVVLFTKLKIGRFLCCAERQCQLDKFVRILEQQCEGAGSTSFLRSALWMLVTLSCLFYTLFLFDTLGDAVGFRGALWVLIVVPLMPIAFYGAYSAYAAFQPRPNDRGEIEGDKASVELTAVVSAMDVMSGDTYNAIIVPASV